MNIHLMSSLYDTWSADEAHHIVKRLEFHRTPEHASWQDIAEMGFSLPSRACLSERNPDTDHMEQSIKSCAIRRNAPRVPIAGASAPTRPGSDSIGSIPVFLTSTEHSISGTVLRHT